MKEKTYYVKDGEKYWRITHPKDLDVRDILHPDLKGAKILSEKEMLKNERKKM